MKNLVIMALCCLFLIIGCQNQSSTGEQSREQQTSAETESSQQAAPTAGADETGESLEGRLAHHRYIIKSVDGAEFILEEPEGVEEGGRQAKPILSFGQWPFASGKICNNFRGDVEVKGNMLFMKNAASTKMFCFDDGLNSFENLFYQLMGSGLEVSFGEGNSLILKGGGHVLVFEAADYVN